MSSESVPYRKRLRAEGYDYAHPGWYFVTICTQERRSLFGSISNGVIDLTPAGRLVHDYLHQLPVLFANVDVDASVVMPNHIHAIIILNPVGDGLSPVTLSGVIQAYKRITTHAYIRNVRDSGWPTFPGRLWQRSFHDSIIRSDRHVDRLREYVESNPFVWPKDMYYTADEPT